MTFGDWVRAHREARGWSQEKLAWTTGMKQHTVSRVERLLSKEQDVRYGHREPLVKTTTVRAIEKRLGVEYPDDAPYSKASRLEYEPGLGYVRRGHVVIPDSGLADKKERGVAPRDAVIDAGVDRTVQAVCAVMNVDTDDFYSKSRKTPLPLARQVVCYLVMDRTNDYLVAMGALRTADHTAVYYNVRKVREALASNDTRVVPVVKRVRGLLDTYAARVYLEAFNRI